MRFHSWQKKIPTSRCAKIRGLCRLWDTLSRSEYTELQLCPGWVCLFKTLTENLRRSTSALRIVTQSVVGLVISIRVSFFGIMNFSISILATSYTYIYERTCSNWNDCNSRLVALHLAILQRKKTAQAQYLRKAVHFHSRGFKKFPCTNIIWPFQVVGSSSCFDALSAEQARQCQICCN